MFYKIINLLTKFVAYYGGKRVIIIFGYYFIVLLPCHCSLEDFNVLLYIYPASLISIYPLGELDHLALY